MISTAVVALIAASGLALGSYAVTAGLRVSRLEVTTLGRSHCDACGRSLSFVQTVPVASYLMLKGLCAHCGARIDPIHLAGELCGAVVLLAAPWGASPLRGALVSFMGLALLASAAVDLKTMRLPDPLTAAIAVAAAALAATHGLAALSAGVVAAAAATVIMLSVRWTVARRRGEPGLGLGDVKLTAALALWLGPATPLMVAIACGLGLAAAPFSRDARGRLPFGPMIAAAGWAAGAALERGWLSWPR